jgi:hypothetical protein
MGITFTTETATTERTRAPGGEKEEIEYCVLDARDAYARGQFSEMNGYFSQAAYLARDGGFDDLEKDIERERWQCMARDPFHIETMTLVAKVLREQPGIVQSKLTQGLQADAELLRLALYVADKVGEIVRVKHGSSYRLFLPE